MTLFENYLEKQIDLLEEGEGQSGGSVTAPNVSVELVCGTDWLSPMVRIVAPENDDEVALVTLSQPTTSFYEDDGARLDVSNASDASVFVRATLAMYKPDGTVGMQRYGGWTEVAAESQSFRLDLTAEDYATGSGLTWNAGAKKITTNADGAFGVTANVAIARNVVV